MVHIHLQIRITLYQWCHNNTIQIQTKYLAVSMIDDDGGAWCYCSRVAITSPVMSSSQLNSLCMTISLCAIFPAHFLGVTGREYCTTDIEQEGVTAWINWLVKSLWPIDGWTNEYLHDKPTSLVVYSSGKALTWRHFPNQNLLIVCHYSLHMNIACLCTDIVGRLGYQGGTS